MAFPWFRRAVQQKCRPARSRWLRPCVEALEQRIALAGDLLVSINSTLYEYTPTGTLVQSRSIPYPSGVGQLEGARSLVVDAARNVHVYDGTFNPYLTTYSPSTGTWSQPTAPGWSTVNNLTYGGIGVFGNYVFVTDMWTDGAAERGIIRFNTNDYSWQRFSDTVDYSKLAVGLDGLVYAFAGAMSINVYDPISLAQVKTITLSAGYDSRGFGVSANGDIYTDDLSGNIYHFDKTGNLIKQVATGAFGGLNDLAVTSDGSVVACDRGGDIWTADATLGNLRSFSAPSGDGCFVAFADPQLANAGLVISGASSPVNAGGTDTFTVTAPSPGYTGKVHFSSGDALATLPADYTFTAADQGVHTFITTLRTAGMQTIAVRDTADATLEGSTIVTVNPLAATTLSVAGLPIRMAPGSAVNFTVTARDVFGNTAPNYAGTVHFSSSDPLAALPGNYTFVAADHGVHTFGVTFNTLGTQALTATDTSNGSITGTDSTIPVVQVAPADKVLVTVYKVLYKFTTSGTLLQSLTIPDSVSDSVDAGARGVIADRSQNVQIYNGNYSPSLTTYTPGTGSWTQHTTAGWSSSSSVTDGGVGSYGPYIFASSNANGLVRFDTRDWSVMRFGTGTAYAKLTVGLDGLVYGLFGTSYLDVYDPLTLAFQRRFTPSVSANYCGLTVTATSDVFLATADGDIFHFTNQGAFVNKTSANSYLRDISVAANGSIVVGGWDKVFFTDESLSNINFLVLPNNAQGNFVAFAASQVNNPALRVTGLSSPLTAGTAATFTVAAPTNYTGTVHFSSTDSSATLPADYTFTAADQGKHTFSLTLRTAGSQSLTAADPAGILLPASATTTVNAAAANSLVLLGYPSPVQAGAIANFTVTARDAYGNTATSYTGTVHLTSSDSHALLPGDYTFTPADQGSHNIPATLTTVGTQSFTATDTHNASFTSTQSGILVTPGAPSILVVAAPTTATAGSGFNFSVTVLDAYANVVTGYTGTLHFTSSDGQAALPADYPFLVGDQGKHTFSATLKTAGSQSLTATDTSDSSVTGSRGGITVGPASAARFALNAPTTATAGSAFSVSLTAQDAYGNTVPGYTGTVHFTSSDAQAGLPADYTFTASDHGIHSVNATLKRAGNQSLTATDTGNASITGTQSGIRVSPAAATHLNVTAPASATAGTAFGFTVTAVDAYGNPGAAYAGTVHFTSSDSRAQLPADYSFVAADQGVRSFSATLIALGSQSLTVADATNPGISGTQSGITVGPGAASQLTVSAPGTATAGTAFPLTVTAQDAFGNIATGYTGTIHFTSSDAQPSLPADFTFTAADHGVHTFNSTLKTAGSQMLTVADTTNGNLQAGATVVVSAAGVSSLSVAGPPTMTAGVGGVFTISARDAYSNLVPGYTGTVTFTSSDLQASLPAAYTFTAADHGTHSLSATLKTVGSQSFTAQDTAAGLSGSQGGIAVSPAAASKLIVSGYPSSTTAGSAQTLTVTALDAYGNLVTGFTDAVHFTSSDGHASLPADYSFGAADHGTHSFSATLKTAGSQSLTATDTTHPAVAGMEGGIAVSPAVAALLSVSTPTTATAGAGFNLTVTAQDVYGNTATSYTGTVHFTSSDSQAALPADYRFTAGDEGVHSVSATLKTAGNQSLTATDTGSGSITGSQGGIAVSPAVAAQLTVSSPASATAGTNFFVTVTALDAFGNTATGYIGTLHFTSSDAQAGLPPDGTLSSGASQFRVVLGTVGSRTITATDTATASLTGTSPAIAVSPGAASHFSVSGPASAVMGYAASATVTARDDYGNLVPGYRGTVQWSSGDGLAVLPVKYTFASSDNGQHTFSLTFNTEGAQPLSVTDTANGSVKGSTTVPVNDPIKLFVTQSFKDLLNRSPDAGGLAYWVGRIKGGTPRSEIATELTHTDEYYTTIIIPAYQAFLGRTPDAGGLNFWVSQMRTGLTDEQLQSGFIGSPEYYQHAGGTDKAWVDAMYLNLLGRLPDGTGENYWVQQLAQGVQRSGVAYGFAASAEDEGIHVQGDYQHYLLRSANAGEVNYWVGVFTQGVVNEDVVAGFVGSPEYFLRSIGQ